MAELITAIGFASDGDRILAATNTCRLATGRVSAILEGLDTPNEEKKDQQTENKGDEQHQAPHLLSTACKSEHGRIFGIESLPKPEQALLCHRRTLAIATFNEDNEPTALPEITHSIALSGNASCCRRVSDRHVVVGFDDGHLRLLDLERDAVVEEKHKHSSCINDIAFNKETGHLAVCSEGARASLWSLPSSSPSLEHITTTRRTTQSSSSSSSSSLPRKRSKTTPDINTWLSSVDLSSNGAWMACGGTDGAQLWNVRNMKSGPATTLSPPNGSSADSVVTSVRYAGHRLFAAHENGRVCGYDGDARVSSTTASGTAMLFALESNAAAAPPHLQVLASGGDGGCVHLLFGPLYASVACSVPMKHTA